jgi:hypothetical protein
MASEYHPRRCVPVVGAPSPSGGPVNLATTMVNLHPDDTECREGTRSVPDGWLPCCEVFAGHVETCAYDLRYEFRTQANHWFVAIPESAGGGGVEIGWCPHCGSFLTVGGTS